MSQILKCRIVLIFVFSMAANTSLADPWLPMDRVAINRLDHVFIGPKEIHPGKSRGIVESAPAGVLVSVGSERSFFLDSMAAKATHLIQIDRVIEVVAYNRINTLLLALSHSREDYQFLRMQASHDEWLERLKGSQWESRISQELFRYQHWEAWRRFVSKSTRREFQILQRTSRSAQPACEDCFQGVNYIFEDQPYERLAARAKADAIEAHFADLTKPNLLGNLLTRALPASEKIAMLDLSNAWETMSAAQMADLLEVILPKMAEQGVLMITQKSPSSDSYDFFGFTKEMITAFPTPHDFMKTHISNEHGLLAERNGLISKPLLDMCEQANARATQIRR